MDTCPISRIIMLNGFLQRRARCWFFSLIITRSIGVDYSRATGFHRQAKRFEHLNFF